MRNYSYPFNFGNGTITTIKDMNINDTNASANLSTANRDPVTLYPYWSVQVPLDHIYVGKTYAVTVDVWADSGTVFNGQRDIVPTTFPTPHSSFNASSFILILEIIIVILVLLAVAIIGVLIYALKSEQDKKSQHYKSSLFSTNPLLSLRSR